LICTHPKKTSLYLLHCLNPSSPFLFKNPKFQNPLFIKPTPQIPPLATSKKRGFKFSNFSSIPTNPIEKEIRRARSRQVHKN